MKQIEYGSYQYKNKPVYDVLKRIFDIIFSLIALCISIPIILVAAICIKIEDNGPVFFCQTRLTKNGKPFIMYKLRTMKVDADKEKNKILNKNEQNGPAFKMQCDPRITKVGKFLRSTSIDELPQFFNVLKGDMSVVGPRPPIISEAEQYDAYQSHRLDVLGGITCIWQCEARNKVTFDEWVNMDLTYIQKRSIGFDCLIILKTILSVLKRTGM